MRDRFQVVSGFVQADLGFMRVSNPIHCWFLIGLLAGLGTMMLCQQLITADGRGSLFSSNHIPEIFGLFVAYLTTRARAIGLVISVPSLILIFRIATSGLG